MKSIYEQWKSDGELQNVLTLVRKWRGDGMELDDIAKNLGISRSTLFEYKNKYSDFSDALKTGREVMDATVEHSLLRECIGYEYEETTTVTTAVIDKKTGQVTNLERVEKRTTKKYARPSATAIAYYLNNREPSKWKNRVIYDDENDNGILPKLLEALVNAKNGNGTE